MTIDLSHPHTVTVTMPPARADAEGSLLRLLADGPSGLVVGDLIWPNVPALDQF
ncbi:hypothetical protein JN535_19000 [Cellulosimicrobium cellulans]|uniref:hypothetical protein n=1 Tax=Cellulosimicrobium cellulans TaxID=1710 RepID=UPI0019660073|nr:hypothetical protein [Cellulosimicrobium cellulans]MBN0042244.1 hypothetical protein [Cellulosimicrobium cellulans]